jgi:CBS domain-containing protein
MNALGRSAGETRTVQDAGPSSLILTYPDEILEQAVAKMAVNGVGRLPVVDRNDPKRLIGCLGRSGIAVGWGELLEEEEVREAGWLTSRMRLLRRNVRRVLEGPGVPG